MIESAAHYQAADEVQAELLDAKRTVDSMVAHIGATLADQALKERIQPSDRGVLQEVTWRRPIYTLSCVPARIF